MTSLCQLLLNASGIVEEGVEEVELEVVEEGLLIGVEVVVVELGVEIDGLSEDSFSLVGVEESADVCEELVILLHPNRPSVIRVKRKDF